MTGVAGMTWSHAGTVRNYCGAYSDWICRACRRPKRSVAPDTRVCSDCIITRTCRIFGHSMHYRDAYCQRCGRRP